ncbi:NADH-quinone oxidoreductase subunit J [Leisingera aquaemixtae]|uniref:NADH-quinone oxidoreductase subunit J n=1 Tax=Leisingera TaxID=191028 RepID=UPI001C941825|nr:MULTISPECIES: NADH-quinone oxidoreductase subunit J [Leisingera]MBY6066609.1 NADH-quinone oxidoreductase subunit J [Leisingera aquaemixtae]MCB4455649.1 NADH-quinone oxidoreductase subunit J [Leisingera sp. McT4-56]
MEQAFFILLSAVAVGAGLLVVIARNPIHSALALVACLVQIAALYVLLGAPFLAVIQIFVYVGAVMVLFLFVIMMLDVRKEAQARFLPRAPLPGVIVLLILAGELIFLLLQSARLHAVMGPGPRVAEQPSVADLSLLLFQEYLLPFEVASVILLVALIGAVVLARSDEADEKAAQGKATRGAAR